MKLSGAAYYTGLLETKTSWPANTLCLADDEIDQ